MSHVSPSLASERAGTVTGRATGVGTRESSGRYSRAFLRNFHDSASTAEAAPQLENALALSGSAKGRKRKHARPHSQCMMPGPPLPALLDHALASRDYSAFRSWLDEGGTVDAVWAGKVTLLHLAASFSFERLVDALISQVGAPIDEQEEGLGLTALMVAAAANDPASVRSLLRAGADLRLRDVEGRTALDIAKLSRSGACARAIEEELRMQDVSRVLAIARIAEGAGSPRAPPSALDKRYYVDSRHQPRGTAAEGI